MENKTRRCSNAVICLAGVVIILGLGIHSAFCSSDFWKINIGTCLTLLVAIIISFFLVQQKESKKEQKEALIRLLEAIQGIATDPESYSIKPNSSAKAITMRKRTIKHKGATMMVQAADVKDIPSVTTSAFYCKHLDKDDYCNKWDVLCRKKVNAVVPWTYPTTTATLLMYEGQCH